MVHEPIRPSLQGPSYLRKLVAGMLALVVSGCAPNAVRYFEPTMAGGTPKASHCVPVTRTSEAPIGPVTFRVSSVRAADDRIFIIVNLIPNRDMTVHYSDAYFRLLGPDGRSPIAPFEVRVRRSDKATDPAAPYVFDHTRIGPHQFAFTVELVFADRKIERFEMIAPSLVIDGAVHDVPSVTFEQQTWVGISPLNC